MITKTETGAFIKAMEENDLNKAKDVASTILQAVQQQGEGVTKDALRPLMERSIDRQLLLESYLKNFLRQTIR